MTPSEITGGSGRNHMRPTKNAPGMRPLLHSSMMRCLLRLWYAQASLTVTVFFFMVRQYT